MIKFFALLFIPLLLLIYWGHEQVLEFPWKHYQDEIQDIKHYRKNSIPLLGGKNYRFDSILYEKEEFLKSRWETLPFSNYLVPIPIEHEEYYFHGEIKFQGKNRLPKMGYSLMRGKKDKDFRFLTGSIQNFDFKLKGNHQLPFLLTLPYSKKIFLSKTIDQIWKDFFLANVENYKNKKLDELIYQYYILTLRKKYIPKNVSSISLLKRSDDTIGILKLNTSTSELIHEEIWIPYRGSIATVMISYRPKNLNSLRVRKRILESIKFQRTSSDNSMKIYQAFKFLSFKKKMSEIGFTLLFTSWTHVPFDQKFLKHVVEYMQRKPNTFHYLKPIYSYGFSQFGKSWNEKKNTEQEIPIYENKKIIKQDVLKLEEKIELYLKEAKGNSSKKNSKKIRIN